MSGTLGGLSASMVYWGTYSAWKWAGDDAFSSRLSAVRCLYLATSFGVASAVRVVAVRMGVVGCLVGRKESADYPIDASVAFSLVEYPCIHYHDFVCIVCLYLFVQYLGTCGTETGGSDATFHVMLPIVTLSCSIVARYRYFYWSGLG